MLPLTNCTVSFTVDTSTIIVAVDDVFRHRRPISLPLRDLPPAPRRQVEWMSDLEIRSLGMVASRMLTNYIKTKEREEQEKGPVEDDDHFDPAYLEVRWSTIGQS